MLNLKVEFDTRGVTRWLDDVQKRQIPFASALALTRIGKLAASDVKAEMVEKFDRPTPWTLRGVFSTLATKSKLETTVGWKDRPYGGNRLSSVQMLAHQFDGGSRRIKALEQWLQRAGLLSAGEYVAPGAGARLDRYGNMSRGQVQQILSQLRVGPDQSAYASKSTRSKRNVKRAGEMFWSRGGKLPRGVWMRQGGGVSPILVVISAPSYVKRIDVPGVVERAVNKHGTAEFSKALAQALRTAR
jgi:hypothetical protein